MPVCVVPVSFFVLCRTLDMLITPFKIFPFTMLRNYLDWVISSAIQISKVVTFYLFPFTPYFSEVLDCISTNGEG